MWLGRKAIGHSLDHRTHSVGDAVRAHRVLLAVKIVEISTEPAEEAYLVRVFTLIRAVVRPDPEQSALGTGVLSKEIGKGSLVPFRPVDVFPGNHIKVAAHLL